MKDDELGAKYLVSARNSAHTVVPTRFESSRSRQRNTGGTGPSGRGTPSLSLYHSPNTLGSFALMKIPPMPVTRSAVKVGSFGCARGICPLMNPAMKIAATVATLMETPAEV